MNDLAFGRERMGNGTREWSDLSFNIGIGCANDCLYCYARADKLRRRQIESRGEWPVERLNKQSQMSRYRNVDGDVTMFPTTHDITPAYLSPFIRCARLILSSGDNPLLIVSKPRFDCMKEVCAALEPWKEAVEFRFTIGTMDDATSRFWEPGAPLPAERVTCISLAKGYGYRVSVSLEPMLEGVVGAFNVIQTVQPILGNGDIWVGKMNRACTRVDMSVPEYRAAVAEIEELQRDSRILELVREVERQPHLRKVVRWKDSIQQVRRRGL